MEKTSDLRDADDKAPSQSWNKPAINTLRLLATFISFVIIGANDGLYIVFEFPTHTHFSTAIPLVASLASSALASATLADKIPSILGHRGIAIFGPLCHLLASAALARLPAYPYLGYAVPCYALMGLGTGLVEAGWKVWVVQMDMSRGEIEMILGIYSTCYASGFISSKIFIDAIAKKEKSWTSSFYYLLGISALGLISCTAMFWSESAARFSLNQQSRQTVEANAERVKDRTARMYSLRVHSIWFISTALAVLLTNSSWNLIIIWLAWVPKNMALVHPSISESYKQHPVLIGWYVGTMFAKPTTEFLSGSQILDAYLSAGEWVGSRILALLGLN